MAKEEYKRTPKKFIRLVKPYERKYEKKKIKVEGYKQTYVRPRGPRKSLQTDKLTSKSQTMWLMDKEGRFVGRANAEGDTTAKGVAKYGYDQTVNIRDASKYKRIWGRRSSGKYKTVKR